MGYLWDFLLHHGYVLAFVAVLVEQMGAPIPAVPVLIALGALSRAESYSVIHLLGIAIVASVLADSFWYWLGRTRGDRVLKLLCRISLEPDSCVRQTTRVFDRRGQWTLIFAKFVPGLSTVAPPMAGVTRMSLWRFLSIDGAGAAVWAGASLMAGWLFRRQAEGLLAWIEQFAPMFSGVLIVGLAAWVLWKYRQRQKFIELIRVARIHPDEVLRRINDQEDPLIFDLRAPSEVERIGRRLPNSRLVRPGELENWRPALPLDRDLIFYCS